MLEVIIGRMTHVPSLYLIGYTPGWCYTYTFHVGHEYIVLAYNLGKWLYPPRLELMVSGIPIYATQENLEEVTKACGLNPVTRPKGAHADHQLT